MRIKVERKWKKDRYTIGKVYIDGKYLCNSLEDPDRGLSQNMPLEEIKRKKVYGDTAIPSGVYLISWTYSNRFKKMMPLVNDVKGFDGIRIHSGNSAADTLGCILLGDNTKVGWISNSKTRTNQVYQMIKERIDKEQIWLEII